MLKCLSCNREFLYAAKRNEFDGATLTSLETYICPFCSGLDLREVEETQAKIESIVSVKIAEADEWIKKGYEVAGMYASTVNLIRKENKTNAS